MVVLCKFSQQEHPICIDCSDLKPLVAMEVSAYQLGWAGVIVP
jgi:hypothetical protein